MAAATPTSNAPTRPGPTVAATASMSDPSQPASSSASATTGLSRSTWARLAISGTTPPKRACRSIWLDTTDDAHVTTIAVDPAWHRHRIGTRLLVHLARETVRRGAHNLTLEVRVSNHGAQALYQRFGFKPAGIRKNYYVETNEDALVMWAEDVDAASYQERLAALEAEIPGTTIVNDGTQ